MGKELEPIEALDKLLDGYSRGMVERSYYDIVREALQRLEAIEKSEPSEALERIENEYSIEETVFYKEDFKQVRKELKALEIIKKKSVWVGRLKSLFRKYNNNLDVLRFYNANMWVDYQLTKEEFNLLKEVLE